MSCYGNSPSSRLKASTEASLPGAHSWCQTLSGISASGSKLLANREYSWRRHSLRRGLPFANAASRAICASLTSGGLPPRTPIPFIRLCRPSANGQKPQRDSMDLLTAQQFSHARHAQRDVLRAVARKQTMHRSFSRETSHSAHTSGESSSRHDCQRTGKREASPLLCSGPVIPRTGCARTVQNSLAQCGIARA